MPIAITAIVIAIVVLIALSAFFNLGETALTAASRARMHALEQDGNARAAVVNKVLALAGEDDRHHSDRQHAR